MGLVLRDQRLIDRYKMCPSQGAADGEIPLLESAKVSVKLTKLKKCATPRHQCTASQHTPDMLGGIEMAKQEIRDHGAGWLRRGAANRQRNMIGAGLARAHHVPV